MFHEDKRDFRRMQISSVAKLYLLEADALSTTEITATCTDLSATGLAISLSEELEVGAFYRVVIESSHNAINSFDATTRVVRATTEPDGSLTAGLEIVNFN